MIRIVLLTLLFVGFAIAAAAQDPASQRVVEDLLESAGEELSDDTDIQEILEDLEGLRQNPVKINLATREELMRLRLLSEVQINSLMEFRQKTGTIYSLYEMASIDGFSPDVLQKMEPFISFDVQAKTVRKKNASGDLFLRSTRSFTNLEQPEESKFEGGMERYYMRLKHTSANMEFGFVAEKDPGEAFFGQSNKHGFDYNSAFANFRLGKEGNRIYAGDYHVRFGQGLVAWQGFSMGKSAETTEVFRSNQGVRSYSSTDENQFFRGVAGQFSYRNFTFYPFLSSNKLDASVDTLDGKPYFGAFQTSGYHRTRSEISGENAIEQFTGGGHLAYFYQRWTFGLTTVYNRFDAEMNRGDEPYNQFLPEGRESFVAGFDWKGSVRNVFFFGEMAVSANSGKALITGLMLKPASNAELSMVYRNVNKTYFSYFANAFTESSRVNDEHSMYLGLKIFPAPKWSVWAYADFFRFRWIKYTTAAPSDGTEFFVQAQYSPSRQTNFYLRFFQEDKGQRLIAEGLRYNAQQQVNKIRLNSSHAINDQFSLKSRLELSFYSKQMKENGFLLYQDVVYRPVGSPFSANGRVAYFHTDGYNSRLYAYENDVLYSFSIPALYGHGMRGYLNVKYQAHSSLSFWLKLGSTYKFAEKGGESEIRSEIKVQARYLF